MSYRSILVHLDESPRHAVRPGVQVVAFILATSCATAVLVMAGLGLM